MWINQGKLCAFQTVILSKRRVLDEICSVSENWDSNQITLILILRRSLAKSVTVE